MASLNEAKQLLGDVFKRTVGISKDDFQSLLARLEQFIHDEKKMFP